MNLTKDEKKMMSKRLNQLKRYMMSSLEKNRIDKYLNVVNSRELKLLEYALIQDPVLEMVSSRL
jgi:hypothetical protein